MDCKIWKDFEKEYEKYKDRMIYFIDNNKEIIDKLPKNKREYIYKNYYNK